MDMLCSDAREMTVQLRLLFSVTWFGTCLGHEGTCNKRNKIKTTLRWQKVESCFQLDLHTSKSIMYPLKVENYLPINTMLL